MKSIILSFLLLPYMLIAQPKTSRWSINTNGSISWSIDERLPHYDHIEMSGKQVSVVLRYGVNADGSFRIERSMVWPLLRTLPNNTHASLMQRFAMDVPVSLIVNGRSLSNENVSEIQLSGMLKVTSQFHISQPNTRAAMGQASKPTVELTRLFFPSVDKPMLCERYILKNISDKPITVSVPGSRMEYKTDATKGVDGAYNMIAAWQQTTTILKPEESCRFDGYVQAFSSKQKEISPSILLEQEAREALVAEWWSKLKLETPDTVLNTAFAFAKIRASESIYATKGGPMHGPGGESYYAAIWANDQAEYVNPFFGFLGYDYGNESALNAYRHFARFMNADYKPIPSSIIAEGIDIWNGAGDRGDAAMIAYGAARYVMARGNRREAEELWPLIEWCLEYCKRKLNAKGVVASDSDELEGRFPSGEANLCTSSLYYDALISATYLAKELNKKSLAGSYQKQATAMKQAIANYFEATVEGFDTYRYYAGNDILRSWICMPLTVGIYGRKAGTIAALFSPRLWTKDGSLTQAGDSTFWDRSTLYALRGVLASGEAERGMEYLQYYSHQRLLGDHVPYPIEAWPEGGQRHLSAESGLYCRIITEGLFAIRPTGLNSFSMTPHLPDAWNEMALRNICAFGNVFDIAIRRAGTKINVTVLSRGKIVVAKTIHNSASVAVTF